MKQFIQHWARIVESIENDSDSTSSFEDEQLNDSEATESEDSEVNEARGKTLFDEDKYFYEVDVTPASYYDKEDYYLQTAFYNITPNGKVDVIFDDPPKTGTFYTSRDTGVSNATRGPGKIRIQHKDVLGAIINKFNFTNKYKTIVIFREGYDIPKTGPYAGKRAPHRELVCKGYKWDSKTVQAWSGNMTLDEIFDSLKDGVPRTRRKASAQGDVPQVNPDEKIQAGLVKMDKLVTAGAKNIAATDAKKKNNLAYTDSVSGIWRDYLNTGSAAYKLWTDLKSKYGDEVVTKAAIAYDDAQ